MVNQSVTPNLLLSVHTSFKISMHMEIMQMGLSSSEIKLHSYNARYVSSIFNTQIENIIRLPSFSYCHNLCPLCIYFPFHSLAPGRCGGNFKKCNIQTYFMISYFTCFRHICCQANATKLHWWQISIGSVNDFMPPGNKPVAEPMLTLMHVNIIFHCSIMS